MSNKLDTFLLVCCILLSSLADSVIAASPYSSPSLTLLSGALVNETRTLPFNGSVPLNFNLPPDPYTYPVPLPPHVPPHTTILVKFYHYGPLLLSTTSIYRVLSDGLRDVNAHMHDAEEGPRMGTKERWYDDGGRSRVVLLLHPGSQMEWFEWGQALRGLFWWAQMFQGIELYYDVLAREEGQGEAVLKGTGALAR